MVSLSATRSARRCVLLLGAAASLPLSACKGTNDLSLAGSAKAVSTTPGTRDNPVPDRVVLPILSLLSRCDVEHRGLLVDMGSDMTLGRVSGEILGGERLKSVEHDGSTWSVISDKRTRVDFNFPRASPVFASARLVSRGARSVFFSLDGQPLGSVRLSPGETRIVHTGPTTLPIDAGAHTLEMTFAPRPKQGPYAELDWVRIGAPDELETTYGAPTLPDIVSEAGSIGKVPHRSISLRAPAVLRCPIHVPKLSRLRSAVGLFGEGDAEVEASIRVDGEEPVSLFKKSLKGGSSAAWSDIDVSLDAFTGKLVQLELRVPQGTPSGRVLFGDPEIVVPTVAPEEAMPAQVVVVVVLSGLDRDELPPYSKRPEPNLERLTRLADRSTVFSGHQNPTTVVPGVVATLLTGLPPRAHTVNDYGARLPQELSTILTDAHEASIQTAFFSGVPHTFKPFGFDRGTEQFVTYSPVSGASADPLGEAARWIEKTLAEKPSGKMLVVVHARGGHPPWTVSAKQLDTLPPADYTGSIQPRRAAQQLALLRKRKHVDLAESDLVRLGALHAVGLAEADHALGELLDALESSNLDDRSMVILTADGSSGLSTFFADEPPFGVEALAAPLYVQFPKHLYAGQVVDAPTETADITRTVLRSLGLPPMRHGLGQDLSSVASGLLPTSMRPLVASSGDRFLARWDSLVLSTKSGAPPTLCDLALDPTCSFDRRPLLPFATSTLLRALAHDLQRTEPTTAVAKQTATIDDETLAALRVWGSME